MTRTMFRVLFVEAASSSRAQPVTSLGALLVTALMCASILLTAGRTEGAQDEVLRTIDSVGTRSIVVRADVSAGLTSAVLTRLDNVQGIDWAAAFGPAVDVTNSDVPFGTRVPLRRAYSTDFSKVGIPATTLPVSLSPAWGSDIALSQLGLRDGYGGVQDQDGQSAAVVGAANPPRALDFLQPFLVSPQQGAAAEPVTVLVVVANSPSLVESEARVVESLLGVSDPSLVEVTTSSQNAALRSSVEGKLANYRGRLVAAIFALSFLLVAAVWIGLVMLKRRDFGRRRALGASQVFIASLILVQVGILGFAGTLIGMAGAAFWLRSGGDPLPAPNYFVAIGLF